MSYHLRLTGALDADAFAAGLAAVVDRQWVLRTAVFRDGDHVEQVVVDQTRSSALTFRDMRGAEECDPGVQSLLDGLRTQPLDVSRGEVFDATLIRLDDDRHLLTLTFDHLAADRPSCGRFAHELLRIHAALQRDPREDPSAVLGSLSQQYVDWGPQQRSLLASKRGDQ